MFYENGYYVWQGTILLPRLVKSTPGDKVLMEAIVKNVRVDGVKVKVNRWVGVFWICLCEVNETLLSDCIVEIDIVSHWEAFPCLLRIWRLSVLSFGYQREWSGRYDLCTLLSPWNCLILPEIFTVCHSWNLKRYLKRFNNFFIRILAKFEAEDSRAWKYFSKQCLLLS